MLSSILNKNNDIEKKELKMKISKLESVIKILNMKTRS